MGAGKMADVLGDADASVHQAAPEGKDSAGVDRVRLGEGAEGQEGCKGYTDERGGAQGGDREI